MARSGGPSLLPLGLRLGAFPCVFQGFPGLAWPLTLPARDRPFKRTQSPWPISPQPIYPNPLYRETFTPEDFSSPAYTRAVLALLIYPSRFYPKIFDP
jgi:hypothetical protein